MSARDRYREVIDWYRDTADVRVTPAVKLAALFEVITWAARQVRK